MLARRMNSSSPDRSPRSVRRSQVMRSSTGITRSLHTMVESAIAATMTMPLAADRPPMKTKSASASWRSAMGRVSTKVSASTVPSGKCNRPPMAIGRTKMLMASR